MDGAVGGKKQAEGSAAVPGGDPSSGRPEARMTVGRRPLVVGALGLGAAIVAGRSPAASGASTAARLGQTDAGTPVGHGNAPGLMIVREQEPRYDEPIRAGGHLRLARPPGARDDFSPAAFRQDVQVAASYLDPLLRPDEVTMEPGPWLAERWEWSDDNRTITYMLRDGVRWHDGAPLTAEDVAFSFRVYRDDPDSGVRAFFVAMQEAEALDARTLRVALSEVDGGWIFNASTQPIFQAAQYQRFWREQAEGQRTLSGFDWAADPPVGSGPWRIDGWDEGEVRFERNDGYWAGPPAFERMTVVWEADEAARLTAWRRREIDLLWPVRGEEAESVMVEAGRLYVADAAAVMFAAFNFANPNRPEPGIFADVRVRQALSLAIDRRRYAEAVFRSYIRHRAAGTVAQPWANEPELTTPLQDQATAAALLAEAGWFDYDGDGVLDDPLGQRFAVSAIVQEGSWEELPAVLRSGRRDLAAVGIELVVEELPEDAFRNRWLLTRDFDLIAFAYDLSPGFTDFDLYGSAWDIRTNPRGFNPGGYANADVDAAIADVLGSPDVAQQREALGRLQRAVDDDLFGLWFGFPRELVLVAPDVLGFRPNKAWITADTRLLRRSPGAPPASPVAASPIGTPIGTPRP